MKNNKKFLLTLTLGTCLVTSNLHASGIITDEDRVSAELALTKRIDNANGKLQKDYDKWWNDFNKDAGCQANVPAYLNRLADSNPEAVAWLLTGGKAGLVQMNFNSEQREHFNNARTKVFQAESNLIKTGKSMLHNMRVSSQAGEIVLNELIGKVGRLTGKIDELNSTIKNINTRLAGLERELDTEKKERKDEVSKLNAKNEDLLEKLKKSDEEIVKLKESDYSAHGKIHQLELELKEKTTRTDVSKIFEDKLNTLSQTYEDKLKSEREAAANKLLTDAVKHQQELDAKEQALDEAKQRELVLQRENENEKIKYKLLTDSIDLQKLVAKLEGKIELYTEQLAESKEKNETLEKKIENLKADLLNRNNILKNIKEKLKTCDSCSQYVAQIASLV